MGGTGRAAVVRNRTGRRHAEPSASARQLRLSLCSGSGCAGQRTPFSAEDYAPHIGFWCTWWGAVTERNADLFASGSGSPGSAIVRSRVGCPSAIQGRPFSIPSSLARGLTDASYGVLDERLRGT